MSSSALARAAFPKTLKELRLHLCQTGQGSAGARQFIQSSYPSLKASNPSLPILVREAQGTPARVFARFERGVEKHAELDGLSGDEVLKRVQELVK
ncbi:NADH dehydrogenase, alpha subcomplex, subunit 2 [Jaminaea rosea]|uniref:NADH dehydrogenase, alpha subcomplex, subunit 2 n=1 Tax=Jaminaea rosea TaxID=1569628 RepID=A0A316UNE3_9BASI|nr:NADH dehydrogenase, alpha subcomplex, subunit 2 [Jaminaea rosea]PWN25433.1 NADH dehydrogenase, alpha subcomplex, subunit 2 [Jaminaea rosea]